MASCAYDVDHDTGAYHCETGCDIDSICAHFNCSHDELCACNGGAVPDCSPGCVVYIPERCYKSDYSKTQFHHSAEDTNFSSEQCAADQHTGGGSCDPCDPCGGGYGSNDANASHNKTQYSHHAENTDFSSEQAHQQEHTGGQVLQTGGHGGSHGGSYGGSGGAYGGSTGGGY